MGKRRVFIADLVVMGLGAVLSLIMLGWLLMPLLFVWVSRY